MVLLHPGFSCVLVLNFDYVALSGELHDKVLYILFHCTLNKYYYYEKELDNKIQK